MDTYLEFAGNHTMLVFALLVSFFLLLITELRRKASGIVAVEAAAAVALINSDAAVIDLRSAEAFARGHIVGARHIPYDEFDARKEQIGKLAKKTVVAVCETGANSTKAANSLRGAGFESVYGLKGGMTAWSQAGLPVVTGKKTKSKSKSKK
jgi:rhodanese-related sulfurtransferase